MDNFPATLADGSLAYHSDAYTPKMLGPMYPAHNRDAPILEGIDVAGLVMTAIITLGPLAAYAWGSGF